MSKLFKIIFFSFCGLLLITLFLFSKIAKNYIQNNSETLIGRKISIDNVHINYLTSTLKLHGFKIFEKNKEDVFVSFDTLLVNTQLYELITKKLVIEEFYLSGLKLNIIREDSLNFNFDDLIPYFKEDTTKIKKEKKAPFSFLISNIEFNKTNFLFYDKFVDKETTIDDMSVKIPYIGWNQKEKSNADFRFNLDKGGFIESIININPINGEFDAKLTIDKLHLHNFYEYINRSLAINSIDGKFSASIFINGNTKYIDQSKAYGTVHIDDFIITETNNHNLVKAKEITAKITEFDFSTTTLAIDYIKINEPYFNVEVINNKVNWVEIFPRRKKAKSVKEISNDKTSSFGYTVNHIELNNGHIKYKDNLFEDIFNYNLSNINIISDSISSNNPWIKTKSTILLNEKGTINTNFNININTIDFYSKIILSDLNLNDFNIQTKKFLNINQLEGNLNTDIIFSGNFTKNLYNFKGKTELSEFKITKNNQKIIAVKKLKIDAKEILLNENKFLIETIDIDTPYLAFSLDSVKNNFSDFIKPTIAEDSKENRTEERPKASYNIKFFNLKNGQIDYSDNLTGKAFTYKLSQLNIASKFINNNSTWISAEIDSKLNNRGALNATVGYNPKSTDDGNLKFSIENLRLDDFNVYSDYYIGHKFNSGILYYYSDSEVKHGKLASSNNIRVRNSKLEANGNGLYDIPLKLAFYLSENNDNIVQLDLPLNGNLKNPNVSVTNLITKTFSNLIFKIVSTPTKMMTGIFVGGNSDIDQIHLDYLTTTLNKKQKEKLEKLIKIEKKNPKLIIELNYKRDKKTERQIIAKSIISNKYKKEFNKEAENDSLSFKKYVFEKVETDSLTLEDACIKLAEKKEIESIANNNTQQLIKNSMNYLQSKNNETEIFIIESIDTVSINKPRFETNFYNKLK